MVIKISMRILILSVFFAFACTNHNKNCFNKVHKGDYQGAIADCNEAIELDPKNATAYSNRGSAKRELGDYQGACLDWGKAGELGYSGAYKLINEYCNK